MVEVSIDPRTDRSRARAEGLDHLGYGFVGWQMPLALLFVMMSCTWSVGALLDSFAGQTTCESGPGGRVAKCRTESFASLYADGRISLHPGHAAHHGGQFDERRAAARRPRVQDPTVAPPPAPAPGPIPGPSGPGGPGPGPSHTTGRRMLESEMASAHSAADRSCATLIAAVGCDFDFGALFSGAGQVPLANLQLSTSSCKHLCQRQGSNPLASSTLPPMKRTTRRVLAEEEGVHPDSIRWQLVLSLAVGVVNLLFLSNGIQRHPEISLHGGFSGRNLHAVLKLTAAVVLTAGSGVLHHVLQRDAPTAISRLQVLHEAWVDAGDPTVHDPSDFDPFTAAAYSAAGAWTDSIATVLLLMALVEQARAVSPAKEGEVLDMLPIDNKTVRRRQRQAWVFVAGWLYLSAGAVFYRLREGDTFTTLSQSVYFTLVTCSTIGYGEMTPNTTPGRIFLIIYSMFGIALVGMVLLQMGDVLVSASEVPSAWFMRNVVLRLRPSWFPGLDQHTWDTHVGSITAAEVQRRVVWIGYLSSCREVSEEFVQATLKQFGDIQQISVHAKDDSPWALVTFCHREEANPSDSIPDCPAEAAIAANRDIDTHVVLPATRSAVGRHVLQQGGALHSRVRLALAVFAWLSMMCGVGPAYAMHAHSWSYSEALYFSYVTMSTLGECFGSALRLDHAECCVTSLPILSTV